MLHWVGGGESSLGGSLQETVQECGRRVNGHPGADTGVSWCVCMCVCIQVRWRAGTLRCVSLHTLSEYATGPVSDTANNAEECAFSLSNPAPPFPALLHLLSQTATVSLTHHRLALVVFNRSSRLNQKKP